MKKTITLAALALGLAASASATSLTDAVLTLPAYNGTTLEYEGTFSTASSQRALSTLTLVFDWAELNAAVSSTTVTTAAVLSTGTANGANSGLGFMRDNDGNLIATTMHNGSQHVTSSGATYTLSGLSSAVQDGKLAVTLMTMGGNSGSHIHVYDGDSTLLHVQDASLRGSGQWVSLEIGSTLASTIDSIYVFNNTVSTADLATISAEAITAAKAVPEPTAATLSLLVLAGLAARRRRK